MIEPTQNVIYRAEITWIKEHKNALFALSFFALTIILSISLLGGHRLSSYCYAATALIPLSLFLSHHVLYNKMKTRLTDVMRRAPQRTGIFATTVASRDKFFSISALMGKVSEFLSPLDLFALRQVCHTCRNFKPPSILYSPLVINEVVKGVNRFRSKMSRAFLCAESVDGAGCQIRVNIATGKLIALEADDAGSYFFDQNERRESRLFPLNPKTLELGADYTGNLPYAELTGCINLVIRFDTDAHHLSAFRLENASARLLSHRRLSPASGPHIRLVITRMLMELNALARSAALWNYGPEHPFRAPRWLCALSAYRIEHLRSRVPLKVAEGAIRAHG